MDLHSKKILITHPLISEIMGSTVVCAQVAEAFQNLGATVTVLSASFTGPARKLFEERQINVVIDEHTSFNIYDFDYVWIHSQLLPMPFIEQLQDWQEHGLPEGKKAAAFIFNHMSAVDYAPGEQPYIPSLEESIASLEVFVSIEAQQKLDPYYQKDRNKNIPQRIFANPAPSGFAALAKQHSSSTLHTIAVVSNHVPQEVFDAIKLLQKENIQVDIIGLQGTVEEVTPEVLARYDAIITIGKTVQYCLCANKPVYVYDQFGGFGYLNNKNFEHCAELNFSGRGGSKKSAETIAHEIVAGFAQAQQFQTTHSKEWQKQYNIEIALQSLLEEIQPRTTLDFPFPGYHLALASQMRFAWRFYRYWDYEIWVNNEKTRLEHQLEDTQHHLDNIQQTVHTQQETIDSLHTNLNQQQEAIDRLHHNVDAVYQSTSYRLGNMLIKPLHAIAARLHLRRT